MKREDILKSDVTEIIFEERNKQYGAYYLRRHQNRFLLRGLIIACLSLTFLLLIPNIIAFFQPSIIDQMAEIDINASNAPDPKGVVTPEFVPPPPPKENTNVVPVITNDSILDQKKAEKLPDKTENTSTAPIKDTTQKSPGTGTPNGDANSISTTLDRRPRLITPQYASIQDYIKKNTRYPELEKIMGHQGQVMVKALVNADGTLSEIGISKGITPALNKEAIRIVTEMPKLEPGIHNGMPTKVYLRIPIDFQLQGTAQN